MTICPHCVAFAIMISAPFGISIGVGVWRRIKVKKSNDEAAKCLSR